MSGKTPQGGPSGSPFKAPDPSQGQPLTPRRTTSTAMERHASSDRQSLSTTPTQSQVLGSGMSMRSTLSASSQAGGAGTGTLKAPNISTTLAPIAAGSASAENSPSMEKPKSAPATQHRADFSSSYTDEGQQAGTIGRGAPPVSQTFTVMHTSVHLIPLLAFILALCWTSDERRRARSHRPWLCQHP